MTPSFFFKNAARIYFFYFWFLIKFFFLEQKIKDKRKGEDKQKPTHPPFLFSISCIILKFFASFQVFIESALIFFSSYSAHSLSLPLFLSYSSEGPFYISKKKTVSLMYH